MSSIPANLTRVPNLLASRITLGSLGRTGADITELQYQLTTGRAINRPSDDPIGTAAVSVLDDVIERRDQRLRNLEHASGTLDTLDAALGEVNAILIEAKSIASSQIGVGSDAETRQNQAEIIDAMLQEVVNVANRRYQGLVLFGGAAANRDAIRSDGTGLVYDGTAGGLENDLGLSRALPITVSGADAFGALDGRVAGANDLDPQLALDARLSTLNGAEGLGIRLGSINVDVNGTDIVVDLTEAHDLRDVVETLEAEIQAVDPGATVGLDAAGRGLRIVPAAGTITISDPEVAATAADLGIDRAFPLGGADGEDLDPRLTDETLLADIPALTVPLGTIRVENGGQIRDLDLSGADTVQELRNLVQGLGIGVRVEISDDGDRLDFVNERSGGGLSIGEVGGGTTASDLGVRTLDLGTELAGFNDGLGVQILADRTDPVTGLPDPTLDLDFRVTLKDGRTFDVDLAGATTVGDVVDGINAAASGAGVLASEFTAGLAQTGNGLRLEDTTNGGSGTTSVTPLNGSFAAQDLGIETSTTGAAIDGEDRAQVAVDSVFTHLISLRDALRADDERGITLAGEKLDMDISRTAEVRAEVGVRSRRVSDATIREEDLRIQDQSLRSQIADLDFTEAAVRFSLLERQLQAGLSTAARLQQLSLLDFI